MANSKDLINLRSPDQVFQTAFQRQQSMTKRCKLRSKESGLEDSQERRVNQISGRTN